MHLEEFSSLVEEIIRTDNGNNETDLVKNMTSWMVYVMQQW